jgi:Flp pilus assembly pilin Flp
MVAMAAAAIAHLLPDSSRLLVVVALLGVGPLLGLGRLQKMVAVEFGRLLGLGRLLEVAALGRLENMVVVVEFGRLLGLGRLPVVAALGRLENMVVVVEFGRLLGLGRRLVVAALGRLEDMVVVEFGRLPGLALLLGVGPLLGLGRLQEIVVMELGRFLGLGRLVVVVALRRLLPGLDRLEKVAAVRLLGFGRLLPGLGLSLLERTYFSLYWLSLAWPWFLHSSDSAPLTPGIAPEPAGPEN